MRVTLVPQLEEKLNEREPDFNYDNAHLTSRLWYNVQWTFKLGYVFTGQSDLFWKNYWTENA